MGSHDVQNGHVPHGWFFIFIKYALFDRNALVLFGFGALQSAEKIRSHDVQNGHISLGWFFILIKFEKNVLAACKIWLISFKIILNSTK